MLIRAAFNRREDAMMADAKARVAHLLLLADPWPAMGCSISRCAQFELSVGTTQLP